MIINRILPTSTFENLVHMIKMRKLFKLKDDYKYYFYRSIRIGFKLQFCFLHSHFFHWIFTNQIFNEAGRNRKKIVPPMSFHHSINKITLCIWHMYKSCVYIFVLPIPVKGDFIWNKIFALGKSISSGSVDWSILGIINWGCWWLHCFF